MRTHADPSFPFGVPPVIYWADRMNPDGLQDETPLQLHMYGVDLYMNSHFDDWIVDISSWRPGPIDEENWRVPYFCNQVEAEDMQRHHLDSSLAMEVAKQLPNPHSGESTPS